MVLASDPRKFGCDATIYYVFTIFFHGSLTTDSWGIVYIIWIWSRVPEMLTDLLKVTQQVDKNSTSINNFRAEIKYSFNLSRLNTEVFSLPLPNHENENTALSHIMFFGSHALPVRWEAWGWGPRLAPCGSRHQVEFCGCLLVLKVHHILHSNHSSQGKDISVGKPDLM